MDGVGVAVLMMDLMMLIRSGGQKFWSDGCVVLAVGMGLYALGVMLVFAGGAIYGYQPVCGDHCCLGEHCWIGTGHCLWVRRGFLLSWMGRRIRIHAVIQ